LQECKRGESFFIADDFMEVILIKKTHGGMLRVMCYVLRVLLKVKG
jgi:hypothetical protein